MSFASFSCRHCGHCCIHVPGAYANSVEIEDIEIWEEKDRQDILAWVKCRETDFGTSIYYLWFDPQTSQPVDGCPWLEHLPGDKTSCLIHDVKPRHCRDWPMSMQEAHDSGCPAAE